MSKQTSGPLANRSPLLAMATARARALLARRALPPGAMIAIDELERGQRTLLLDLAARHGPVFKGLMENRLVVCVLGLAAGRRVLKDHAAALRPVAIRIDSVVPEGFLRRMQGERHREVRGALVRGLSKLDEADAGPDLRSLAAKELMAFDAAHRGAAAPWHAWSATLSRIATSMLLRVVFGARSGSAAFDKLALGYHELGPHGVVWHLTRRQELAYGRLVDMLRSMLALATDDTTDELGLLGRIVATGPVDDTLLGNLIYMVELGRYDLRGLLRWISVYAARYPMWTDRLAAEARAGRSLQLAQAFVLETLRMDQSERLMREVCRDIVFDGWLIPKGALLRVCLWESHKDAATFGHAFAFDPQRFCGDATPDAEHFAPFGLDHHRCPFAAASVDLAAAFARALSLGWQPTLGGDGAAVRGPYHWEPAPGATLRLLRRDGASSWT